MSKKREDKDIMNVMEDKNYKSLDMFGVERQYHFKIKKIGETKRGSNHAIVFFTDPKDDDDSLRYIEDIAEEVCTVNKIAQESSRFFEIRGKDSWEIEMNWDNNRFRGTSWVPNEGKDLKLEALIKSLI